jgi:hypothetical protein
LVGIDGNALEVTHGAEFLTPDSPVAKRNKRKGRIKTSGVWDSNGSSDKTPENV